jgi:hypothetical protein
MASEASKAKGGELLALEESLPHKTTAKLELGKAWILWTQASIDAVVSVSAVLCVFANFSFLLPRYLVTSLLPSFQDERLPEHFHHDADDAGHADGQRRRQE